LVEYQKVKIAEAIPAGSELVGKVQLQNTVPATINPATEDTLAAIKNTDGIKKIADALPAGSNTIGNVTVSSVPADIDIRNLSAAQDDVTVYGYDSATPALIALAVDTAGKLEVDKVKEITDTVTADITDDETRKLGEVKKIVDALPAGSNTIGNVTVSSVPADVDIRDLNAAQDSLLSYGYDSVTQTLRAIKVDTQGRVAVVFE